MTEVDAETRPQLPQHVAIGERCLELGVVTDEKARRPPVGHAGQEAFQASAKLPWPITCTDDKGRDGWGRRQGLPACGVQKVVFEPEDAGLLQALERAGQVVSRQRVTRGFEPSQMLFERSPGLKAAGQAQKLVLDITD
jgi:hypothetical protein